MVTIIYSSIGGNTELVCLKVAEVLKNAGVQTQMLHYQNIDINNFIPSKLTILAAPTYQQGTLDKSFEKFMATFSKQYIAGNSFGVIGLGDTKYYVEYLTESASILEKIIQENGGNLVINSLRINGLPVRFLDSLVAKWAEKIANLTLSN